MAEATYRRQGSRFRARRRAVSLLFEAEMRGVDPVELALERREMGASAPEFPEVAPFAIDLVTGTAERLSAVDEYVSEHLQGWTLGRLPAIERAILRAGTWELLFSEEQTAAATVIDQAVMLTEELAAPKSIAYINAVLDRIAGLSDQIRAAERAVSALDRDDAPDEALGNDPADNDPADNDPADKDSATD